MICIYYLIQIYLFINGFKFKKNNNWYSHFGVKYGINNDKENFKNILNVINYLNKNKVELFFDCSEIIIIL